MTKEALKLALEAFDDRTSLMKWQIARDALKKALAQPEQEPVAWMHPEAYKTHFTTVPSPDMIENGYWQPLYTTPPQRKPLTDEEISSLWDGHTVPVFGEIGINPIVFARAIEAAHGIKGEA